VPSLGKPRCRPYRQPRRQAPEPAKANENAIRESSGRNNSAERAEYFRPPHLIIHQPLGDRERAVLCSTALIVCEPYRVRTAGYRQAADLIRISIAALTPRCPNLRTSPYRFCSCRELHTLQGVVQAGVEDFVSFELEKYLS
jgi:hypothetical protein